MRPRPAAAPSPTEAAVDADSAERSARRMGIKETILGWLGQTPDKSDELRFEGDLRAGVSRGIDQHPVEHGPPRRVETIHVALRFDLHRNDLVAVVKRRQSDPGRTRRFDSLENAPARQLEHARAHKRVGGDRIAPVVTAVDREHTKTSSREKQRGGRAGASGSDNDDVEIEGRGCDAGNISNDVRRSQVVSN